MLRLARSFRLDHIDVDVVVCGAAQGIKRGGSLAHGHDDTGVDGGEMVTNIDEEADLLPNFCQHAGKVLLSADWAGGITHIKQCFEGTLSNVGFNLDSERMTRVAVRTDKNLRMGSELVTDVITERVHNKSLTRSTNVKYDFKKAYGLQMSYHVAWLGVEKARKELYGDHSILFDQLHWYNNAIMKYNPGSYINLDFDKHNTRRFNRLFISFKACMYGFNHCRPLLFLDGTFLKVDLKATCLRLLEKMATKRNLKDKMKYVNKLYCIGLVSKLRECAYVPTVADFNEKVEAFIQSKRHIAVNFLQDLKPHHWANAHFRSIGLSCEHVVVAIRNCGSDLNVLVNPYLHVTNYQSSYSQAIFLIPTVEKPQVTTSESAATTR
ncbi:hypothetical protein ACSBR2_005387 [Camellia fascicularis]